MVEKEKEREQKKEKKGKRVYCIEGGVLAGWRVYCGGTNVVSQGPSRKELRTKAPPTPRRNPQAHSKSLRHISPPTTDSPTSSYKTDDVVTAAAEAAASFEVVGGWSHWYLGARRFPDPRL